LNLQTFFEMRSSVFSAQLTTLQYRSMECESVTQKVILSIGSILQNAKQLQHVRIDIVVGFHVLTRSFPFTRENI
jgi:predicted HAD superfamily hydrolase